MDRTESGNADEFGCRPVKGPHLTVLPDTAGDKCAIGLSPTPSGRKGTHSKARQAYKQTLNIVRINTSGISNKKAKLGKLFNFHSIHVALQQETQHRNTDLHMTVYTPHPCKCEKCHGIVTYIRNDIHGEVKTNSVAQPADILEATVWFQGRKHTILNISSFQPTTRILHTSTTLSTIKLFLRVILMDTLRSGATKIVLQLLLHRAHNTLSRPNLTILSSDLHKHNIQVLDNIDGAKAWSLSTNLNGERRRKNPKLLSTGDETILEDQRKAEVFNKYFYSVNKAERSTKKDKTLLRKLKQKEKAPGVNLSLFEDCFKLPELNLAMKNLKLRKSPGPDRLHNETLLHLGLEGKKVLLKLINKTWDTSIITSVWKTAVVTPILKKRKAS
ncbi:Pol protein [Elysia marginata]|uniref:Pol protein n=1 Tax=Elysia marginata TaxID=1093978 RepID=A0AAV4GR41_9GAST|nr:Pol protein [Elysia marginata]